MPKRDVDESPLPEYEISWRFLPHDHSVTFRQGLPRDSNTKYALLGEIMAFGDPNDVQARLSEVKSSRLGEYEARYHQRLLTRTEDAATRESGGNFGLV